ncbi:MAG: glycosyl hydrolase family 28-related protein [Opitutaceae bacterium]
MRSRMLAGLAGLTFWAAVSVAASVSFYTQRPDDPQALCLERPTFSVVGDGVADDTAALQQAIDRVQETTGKGVLLIPEGRYRISRTLHVWAGIRLIGYGARRPVLLLGAHTPGYAEGEGKYLVHFVSDRPKPGEAIRDANPGTFYSALSNTDIEIEPGNPAAVGVRAHFAQHCHLAHIEFRIGEGRAGVEEVGNEAEDLRFIGGEFGIAMHKPSPSWPFVLLDAVFEGQRRAAIETEEGGLTLIRPQFRRVPTAVLVRPERSEELWLVDARLEDVSGPAILVSEERSARTMINVTNAVCTRVPVFARFRESGREVAGPAPLYAVRDFCHGLQFAHQAAEPAIRTTADIVPLTEAPPSVPSDIAALPPMAEWANVRAFGALGDGVADDTAALRRAIAAHRTVFLPTGRYRVSDTITLRPDSVLVAMSPTATQILLADDTPAFGASAPVVELTPAPTEAERAAFPAVAAGSGAPKALLEAPPGGHAIVTGLGLDTGGRNPRAVALKWMSGEHSLVNDVRFVGGHGTYRADGSPLPIYNNNRTADADPRRRWDSQYWSLWVTAGGGGTFKGLWTPSPFAAAGLHISDTDTSGRIYALSSEHHVRNEVKLRRVANWRIYALQTEAERGESPHALPLEIVDSRDLTIGNLYLYRVDTDTPFPCGVAIENSRGVDLRGVHVYSPGKLTYDNTVRDRSNGIDVRSREIAWLKISDTLPSTPAAPWPPTAEGAQLERVATGFTNADAMVVDAAGDAFFLDARWQRIHRWSPTTRRLTLVLDAPLQPVALALDDSGGLLILSRSGTVYRLRPGESETALVTLVPTPAANRPDATAWLPVSRWRDGHDWHEANTRREPLHYVAPDNSIFIPAPESFAALGQPGVPWWRRGTVDLIRSYTLAPAVPGRPFYVADEFGQTTWRFRVLPDGSLTGPERFAEEGEAGVTVDAAGNVYVCAGQVFVYAPDGRQLGIIPVPERPTSLAFAGANRGTLLITARTSLYSLQLR